MADCSQSNLIRNRLPVILFLAVCLFGPASCDQSTSPDIKVAAPHMIITQPEATSSDPIYAKVILFGWTHGEGMIVSHTRYLWSLVVDTTGTYNPGFDIIKDLNENPWRYENKWSPWNEYSIRKNLGTSTILGDDENLQITKWHIFAVQAKDPQGRITTSFIKNVNVRRFNVSTPPGPFLLIYEPLLHVSRFLGTSIPPKRKKLPPGIPLRFQWEADAGHYGGTVTGYRYGWDIADLESWDQPYSTDATSAVEIAFHSGVHTVIVETIDLAGNVTRGGVETEIIPFPMERNLLFVDDFFSTNFQQTTWEIPTETQHDEFWLGICTRANGFDPGRDVYDAYAHGSFAPSIEHIGMYKNIIWTYSSTSSSAWRDIVYFTPESEIGQSNHTTTSYLSIFLQKGGHLLTLGRSDASGGLAAILKTEAQLFPMRLRCEITGNRDNCRGDKSGANSLAYNDYCISVLDKIKGLLRTDSDMPYRSINQFDVMTHAVKDSFDLYTVSSPGMPERLDLWEEITKPGRFFDPDSLSEPGGFTYVEVYNPEYWMNRKHVNSQFCFHPMYRMRSKSEDSALDNGTVAIWVTKYSDIVPEVSSGTAVAAPSFHFGLPLWFFEREAVDSIMNVVFETWDINE